MPQPQLQPLIEIGPFEGWDVWQSPWTKIAPSTLTDVSFIAFDEILGAAVSAKGRQNLFTGLTDPLGLDVFYVTTGNPFAILVADGVWKLLDYVNLTAPVNISLPASGWDTGAQTYFVLSGSVSGRQVLMAANGLSTPLKMLDTFDPAAPVATKVGISTPLTAPTAADSGITGNLNGTYRYRVTFESVSHESSPGPIGQPLTVSNKKVSLTAIPTSSDPTVIKRNLWRLGGSVPEWRLIGSILDNSTTLADDNVADLDVGRILDFDRDPPVANMTVLLSHKGRVFGFVGNNLHFSNFDEPEGWNPTNILPIGKGDNIVTLGTTGSVLLAFKHNQTWAIFGETIEDFVRVKLFDIGCVGPRAVASAPGAVYWLAEDGVRRSNGQDIEFIGAPVYTLVRDLPSAVKQTCVMSYGLGKLVIGFPENSTPLTLVYDIKTNFWEKYPFAPKQVLPLFAEKDPGFFGFTEYTNNPEFSVRRWPGSVYGDLGSPASWLFERKNLDSGLGKAIKVYRELEIVAPKQTGISVTVTLTVEDDLFTKQKVLTVPLDSGPIRVGLQPELRGTYINIKVSGSHSSKVEIHKIRLWGWAERLYSRDAS